MPVTKYTDKSFYELTGSEKSTFSFLRLFNTLLDEDRETKFLNIFRSYITNENILSDIAFFGTYEVSNGEYWDNVSYNLYETPYLWWVIALLNNISNPFEELEDGDILSVLKEDYVYQLITDLEKIAED
jgi:hypothetical protein